MVSAIGPDLKSRLAGIEDVLRIQFWDEIILKKDDENYFNIPGVCVADSSFFDFFEQIWIYGSPKDALNKPLSLVLTDELAKTIFGDINPVGLTLLSQSGSSVINITGVIKKRDNSHLHYDALLSLVTRGRKSLEFRRGLILFQFIISVILINSSLLVSRQLKYTREKDLGFEKEQILTIDLSAPVLRNMDNVRKQMLQNPEIINVSYSYTIPGSHLNYEGFSINNKNVTTMVFIFDQIFICWR